MSEEDENSWSIHDLDHAPEPPTLASSGYLPSIRKERSAGSSSAAVGLSPRIGAYNSSRLMAPPTTPHGPSAIGLRDRTWSAPAAHPKTAYYQQAAPMIMRDSPPHATRSSSSLLQLDSSRFLTRNRRSNSVDSPSHNNRNQQHHQNDSHQSSSSSSTRYMSLLPPIRHRRSNSEDSSRHLRSSSVANMSSLLDGPSPSWRSHRRSSSERNVAKHRRSHSADSNNPQQERSFLSLPDLEQGDDSQPNSGRNSATSASSLSIMSNKDKSNNNKDKNNNESNNNMYWGDILVSPAEEELNRSSSFNNLPDDREPMNTDYGMVLTTPGRRRSMSIEKQSTTWDDSSHYHEDEEGGEEDDDSNESELTDSAERDMETKPWWKRPPSLHRVATCVVTYASCFWCWYIFSFCFGGKASAASRMRQPTDRAILARLNTLVAFFAIFQMASALFLTVVTFSHKLVDRTVEHLTPNEIRAQSANTLGDTVIVWNVSLNVFMLGVEAFVLVVAAILTVRVVRNVNLVGAIRYLWVLLWILPFQIFFNIGLYDYFRVTGVWVKNYWRDETMGWFRAQFCVPSWTANSLCAVPIAQNETNWCLKHYNATNCAVIRDNAQQKAENFLLVFYYSNASWGLILICLLVLVVNTLEGIISKPLVQKSRQSNVPAWLSLPIVSCVVFGLVFSYAKSSGLGTRTGTDAAWFGPLYLATAGLFFAAAVLGWYISVSSIRNTRHKRNKMLLIYCFIGLMTLISGALIALFITSLLFSSSFVEVPLSNSQRGNLACLLDQAGICTNCDGLFPGQPVCPQWSVSDVTKVIQTQAKTSAALAAILLLYAINAFFFGLGMRKHFRIYQIDYV